MSNAMKSTGKTVDEAVREALLRMGLRRDEVSVTVIQEARGGLLGFGRRDAVVEVAKKSEFDRDGRRRGSNSRRRGGEGGDEKRQEARGGRGGERRGGRGGEPRDGGESKGGDNKGGDRSRRGGRGRSRGRGRDEDTREQPVAAEAAGGTAPQAARQDNRPAAATQDNRRDERRDEDGKDDSRRRRRRPRRRRKPSDQDEARDQQAAGATATPTGDQAAPVNQAQPAPESVAAAAKETVVANVSAGPQQEAAPTAAQVEDPASPSVARAEDRDDSNEAPQEAPTQARAADMPAATLVKPFNPDDVEDEVELLTRTATALMVKAGFQSRVTVKAGDYHQVKMVVDDRSAGVLIGRQGSTVDAVEHLVDRIAARVAGERVKFNLDINNYRLRREDGLLGATRRAMTDARESGQPVAMEPAGGRERRIVHLEVAEDDDLVTYTEDGENGKFVVICRPDQVPAQYRDPEVHGEAPVAAEAPEEPRVDG